MLIRLSEDEKNSYCIKLGSHLPRLRSIIGLTQSDLANICGISKERISRIENGAFVMRWAHFVNLSMIFSMNPTSKDYMFAQKIFTPRLLQALQMKDVSVPPDIQIPLSDSLTNEFYTDYRILNSLSNDYLKREDN